MMLRKEYKKKPTKHPILLLIIITISIFNIVVCVPAEAFEVTNFTIFNKNYIGIERLVSESKTKTVQMNLSQKIKTVKKETSESTNQNSSKRQMVTLAKEDLAARLSVEVDQIKLLEVREVTWPDASFGCPQPGKVYSQAVLNGFLIRLEAGGRMYFYHSAGTRNPFLCEKSSKMVPHPSKINEFVPPPGSKID